MKRKTIDSSKVIELILSKKCNLIDVRDQEELEEEGKIPYSKNIPLKFIIEYIGQLNKDLEYIMVCKTGKRSNIAVQVLEIYGYKVISLEGGIENWNGPYEDVPEIICLKKQV